LKHKTTRNIIIWLWIC